jgi:hypothetical protein
MVEWDRIFGKADSAIVHALRNSLRVNESESSKFLHSCAMWLTRGVANRSGFGFKPYRMNCGSFIARRAFVGWVERSDTQHEPAERNG